jgi:uncharacterized membrane protein
METRASIAKHPIHPMLITVPIGLWVFSLAGDLIALGATNPIWYVVAWYAMAGGVIGALVAALPGLVDLFTFRNPPLIKIGVTHMVANLVVVGLYCWNLYIRRGGVTDGGPLILSVLSIILLFFSGWLGASLVHVYGVGVVRDPMLPDEGAEDAEKPHAA